MDWAAMVAEKLQRELAPERLSVTDESDRHAGHAGARPGGGTHFRVEVVSRRFEGKSRLERQRMVYAALAEDMQGRLHALQLRTLTPAEDAAAGG
jgi:BolA protein